jgi:ADP-ribosyl-[dinitrogen reductase] hydrolase
MALCLAASLIETGQFDPDDQMERYLAWYQKGYMSSTGRCFDIGGTCRSALVDYASAADMLPNAFVGSTSPYAAGNGSLMRLAPVPMRYAYNKEGAIDLCAFSSRTTHGARTAVDACRLFGAMLVDVLNGEHDKDVLNYQLLDLCTKIDRFTHPVYFMQLKNAKGSGYVVESLEAAIWCFLTSSSFEEAVLKAVNLGDDSDTTGAITGQIAGAYYGYEGIPQRWRDRLYAEPLIRTYADQLYEAAWPEEI